MRARRVSMLNEPKAVRQDILIALPMSKIQVIRLHQFPTGATSRSGDASLNSPRNVGIVILPRYRGKQAWANRLAVVQQGDASPGWASASWGRVIGPGVKPASQ